MIRALRPLFVASYKRIPRAVWNFLKGDPIDLSGFSLPTRLIVWLGFGLLFVAVGVLLLGSAWRALFPLMSGIPGSAGRGVLVPEGLLPLTHLLVAVGWAFMLAGAIHARRLFRIGLPIAYLVTAAIWSGSNVSALGFLHLIPIAVALLAVPAFFVLRRTSESRPVLEFVILLIFVTAAYGYSQLVAVGLWRASGTAHIAVNTYGAIETLRVLATPLLIMGGLGVAEFAYRLAHSTIELLDVRPHYRLLAGALLLLFAWRLYDILSWSVGRYGQDPLGTEVSSYAGALGVPLCVGMSWWLTMRRGALVTTPEEVNPTDRMATAAKQAALPLALAYLGTTLAASAVLLGYLLLGLFLPETDAERTETVIAFAVRIAESELLWTMSISVLAVAFALRLARRGRRLLALFLCVFGLTNAWTSLPFDFLRWDDRGYVAFWWVVIFAAFALSWLRRGELSEARIKVLLLLLLTTALLNYPAFIADPLSPFLGFAGIGFVAFGILYGALTGGAWANGDSSAMPRIGRVFIHLGYVLFGVAIVVWPALTHDVSATDSVHATASTLGFDAFGKALLYAVFAVALASASQTPEQVAAAGRPVNAKAEGKE